MAKLVGEFDQEEITLEVSLLPRSDYRDERFYFVELKVGGESKYRRTSAVQSAIGVFGVQKIGRAFRRVRLLEEDYLKPGKREVFDDEGPLAIQERSEPLNVSLRWHHPIRGTPVIACFVYLEVRVPDTDTSGLRRYKAMEFGVEIDEAVRFGTELFEEAKTAYDEDLRFFFESQKGTP